MRTVHLSVSYPKRLDKGLHPPRPHHQQNMSGLKQERRNRVIISQLKLRSSLLKDELTSVLIQLAMKMTHRVSTRGRE